MTFDDVKSVTLKLLDYCQANDWAGYDPYDALNSPIFKWLPFLDYRWPRIVLTQTLKRCPVNLRSLLLIPKTENPKAIALFLMAFLNLRKLGLLENNDLITLMTQKLIDLRSPNNPSNSSNPINPSNSINPNNPSNSNSPYWCWGYSFPWQTRTMVVSRGMPNLVCTTFVSNALLDAHAKAGESRYLNAAVSGAEYILNELYWTEGNSTASFSYPLPSMRAKVHNANFLGAALLCRVYKLTGEKKFLEPALKVARYSAGKQHEDGAWDYGEADTQGWADNFHTGYNLCALRSISHYAETLEFESHILRGFEFYREHFFCDDGAPKYFPDRTYPIDIHSVAQSIITLLDLKDLNENNVNLANSVLRWAIENMLDRQGYFHYQLYPFFTNKISYMRWSQTWMLLALSRFLGESYDNATMTRM